jgi:rhodanese-related sulfurtransferase
LADYLAQYPAIGAHVLQRIFSKNMDGFVQIMDVRPEKEYLQGHIKGAHSFPLTGQGAASVLDKNVPTLLYDQEGNEISSAFDQFKSMGFTNLHTLAGGYAEWSKKMETKNWIQKGSAGASEIRELAATELEKFLGAEDPLILDVRTPSEFGEVHLKNAQNLPVDLVAEQLAGLKKYQQRSILLYCRTQNRSRRAAELLAPAGFLKIYILRGGMQNLLSNREHDFDQLLEKAP